MNFRVVFKNGEFWIPTFVGMTVGNGGGRDMPLVSRALGAAPVSQFRRRPRAARFRRFCGRMLVAGRFCRFRRRPLSCRVNVEGFDEEKEGQDGVHQDAEGKEEHDAGKGGLPPAGDVKEEGG